MKLPPLSLSLKLAVLNAQMGMNRAPNIKKTLNVEAFNKKIFYGIYIWIAQYVFFLKKFLNPAFIILIDNSKYSSTYDHN